MKDESYFKFERSTRAPDGIHGEEIEANEIPMGPADILYVAIIGLTYIAMCTLVYYLG